MSWLNTLVFSLFFGFSGFCFGQTAGSDGFPEGTLFGQTNILNNSVEKGITQTDSGPAIQAAIGYRWGLAKAGLWASNVKYRDATDTVVLRPFGAYQFFFTSNANLTARFDFGYYTNDGSRNGTILSADLELFTYHVLYEKIENWEASGYDNQRVGFRKEFALFDKFGLDAAAGYNLVDAAEYSDYFDLRGAINYRYGAIKFELAGTYASNESEFGSRAGPFLIVGMEVNF